MTIAFTNARDHNIAKSIEDGKMCSMIFCLSKAFESVWHEALFIKLKTNVALLDIFYNGLRIIDVIEHKG